MAWWLEDPRLRVRRAAAVALSLAAWLTLAGFWCGYIEFIGTTGGRSHATFRTAPVEPKQAALAWIRGHRRAQQPATVVCREYWNYWPLAYLAGADANLRVMTWDDWQAAGGPATLAAGQTWFVDFAGAAGEAETLAALEHAGVRLEKLAIVGYGGGEILSVTGPVEKTSQNY